MLLAIVEGIPETDYNVRKVFVDLLGISAVSALYVLDLKMQNVLLGISVRDSPKLLQQGKQITGAQKKT